MNNKEIPAEELKRINNEAIEYSENDFDPGDYRDTAYIAYKIGREDEFLRHLNSKPSQELTGMRWVKASERLPIDNLPHPAKICYDSPEYTSMCVEDMDFFIGEETHYLVGQIPKGLLDMILWLDEGNEAIPTQLEAKTEMDELSDEDFAARRYVFCNAPIFLLFTAFGTVTAAFSLALITGGCFVVGGWLLFRDFINPIFISRDRGGVRFRRLWTPLILLIIAHMAFFGVGKLLAIVLNG